MSLVSELFELSFFLPCIATFLCGYLVYKATKIIPKYRKWAALIDKLPGEPKHWFFGNLGDFPSSDPTDIQAELIKLIRKYPRILRVWEGRFDVDVLLHHPETVKVLLQSTAPKEFNERGSYHNLKPWLGKGLLLSDGEKWSRNRKLLTPAFHFEILNSYFDIYNEATDKLLKKWQPAAQNGESVELFKCISLCTLNILLRCAFSDEADVQEQGESHPYVNAVNQLTHSFGERDTLPQLFLLPDWFYYILPHGRHFKRTAQYVHKIAWDVITKRRKTLEQENIAKMKKRLDFLDILLSAQDSEGQGLTDLEIRQEVDTFMFAGHDTTATGISWVLYSLAKWQEHQDKVYKEIHDLMKQKDQDSIESNDLAKLPYLSLCIKESFRMHSPVPMIGRVLSQSLTVDGYTIPKGTQVGIGIYLMHHNEQIWDDPEEYNPERFRPENTQQRDAYAFLPFSGGSRNCIGQNFAMHEVKTLVARIIHRFKIDLDPNHKVDYYPMVVMRAKDGIKVKLTSRFEV